MTKTLAICLGAFTYFALSADAVRAEAILLNCPAPSGSVVKIESARTKTSPSPGFSAFPPAALNITIAGQARCVRLVFHGTVGCLLGPTQKNACTLRATAGNNVMASDVAVTPNQPLATTWYIKLNPGQYQVRLEGHHSNPNYWLTMQNWKMDVQY